MKDRMSIWALVCKALGWCCVLGGVISAFFTAGVTLFLIPIGIVLLLNCAIFEWMDGNPDNEDRIGYIVALNGNKIELANSVDDVLGICSGTAMVLGDSAEWNWNKRYLTDDFGRVLYSDYNIEHPATYDNEGEILDDAWTEHIHVPTPNPAYDASQTYIRRSERPEWQIVGLMGKLYVRDNGTCVVNGYAGVSNGIAIKSDNKTNMRVMERVNDTVIRVLLK